MEFLCILPMGYYEDVEVTWLQLSRKEES
jgi:hypothetical protein